jgi:biopolymer transport protein ExbB
MTTSVSEATMNWNLIGMWHSISVTAQGVVIVLLAISTTSLAITVDRALRYRSARRASRAFVHQVAASLADGNVAEAISVAKRNRKSHIAKVVAEGLEDFEAAPRTASDVQRIEVAKRGLARSAIMTHAEMKRGLGGLATIGSTAPFVGLFGTVVGIMNAFRGTISAKTGLSAVGGGIAEALVTTGLGLPVAVPAVWCYNYFTSKMESFDIEMENSSLEVVNYLLIRLEQRKQS